MFTLHFDPDYDAQAILEAHRHWARLLAEPLAAIRRLGLPDNDRAPGRRLRIGFVSPDFRDHPVGRLLLPLYTDHDRRQTEFIAYSDVRVADPVTAKLKALAGQWYYVAGLSTRSWPNGSAPTGSTSSSIWPCTPRAIACWCRSQASPVQVMIGLPATTGLETMDARLTDPYLDPPGLSDGDYSERSVRLPHCFWCYQPGDDAPAVETLPALTNGFVTFGCLNQFAKVSRPSLLAWVKILQSLPGSRLVIHAPLGSHRDAVHRLFQDGGIVPDRVEFVARETRLAYLRRYQDLDLCLDPFPYNGGISTLDSLWMGVPVITLTGRTAVGRAGASILSNLGLPELIAETPEQYVAIAVELAADRERSAQSARDCARLVLAAHGRQAVHRRCRTAFRRMRSLECALTRRKRHRTAVSTAAARSGPCVRGTRAR